MRYIAQNTCSSYLIIVYYEQQPSCQDAIINPLESGCYKVASCFGYLDVKLLLQFMLAVVPFSYNFLLKL